MTITASIEELKDGLEGFLARVEAGDELEIKKQDKTIAKLIPAPKTKNLPFGCGADTCKILGKVDEPLVPEEDWDALCGRGPI